MGCCVSTAKSSDSLKQQHSSVGTQPPRPRSDANESRAPPPSAEEETIKEVLSETPKPKPPQPLGFQSTATKPVFNEVKDNDGDGDDGDDKNKIDKFPSPVNTATDNEISEVSKVYSESESVSTTTTKRDEDEEVRQRVNRSSPAKVLQRNRAYNGDMGARRERLVAKSPNRRSEQSPGQANSGSVRLVKEREPGHVTMARRGLTATERRDSTGEGSGRRSRSPATRVDNGANRSVMGRSPSARRTIRSPGRVRAAPTEPNNGRKSEQSSNKGMEEGTGQTTNESLENPLVSLECFIFL
ncbi:proteoglycan 4 [Juglans microcarpa x Juglans regia]|uniref:proteoglycan 4 n=1 Tax=Juglans microcarpa x Juglans regia TaxID=2249226 RepID=UPI001B7DDA78|nr:proteoglycan 4 [Juglans microcarpa x Juglans regia]